VLRVRGKGQKERLLPLRGPILAELRLCLSTDLPHLGRPPQGDDYLLYPIRTFADGKGSEGQLSAQARVPEGPAEPAGGASLVVSAGAEAPGSSAPGVTSGLNMHQARHTFAMELRRVAGIDAASHALGHADLSTTLGIYGHRDASATLSAMERYAEWVQAGAKRSPRRTGLNPHARAKKWRRWESNPRRVPPENDSGVFPLERSA
jgi:integrase